MDVTAWLEWFLDCLARAIARSKETLEAVLFKGKFWESVASIALNQRQRAMLNRLLDGFEGKLTSSKWAKLTKVSHDTALRDITFLVAHRIFVQNPGGGRSTSYSLAVTSPGKQL
jgi:Fic family protein